MSERILSVLVEDKPGVLARVSSTISRRGFNINSLSVGPTNIEGRSKMTIVTELDAVEQVKKQLNKLVNVIKIVELDPNMTIETEVLLLKVSINKDSQTSVIEKASLSNATSVDVGQVSSSLGLAAPLAGAAAGGAGCCCAGGGVVAAAPPLLHPRPRCQ